MDGIKSIIENVVEDIHRLNTMINTLKSIIYTPFNFIYSYRYLIYGLGFIWFIVYYVVRA